MGRGSVHSCLVVCMLLTLTVVSNSRCANATPLEKWLIMPGEVTASHAEIEDECGSCHDPLSDRPQAELCVACHTEVGRDVDEETGLHGRLGESERSGCAGCHVEHEGRDSDIVALDESTFDHTLTDFILRGAHLGTACADCHAPGETHRQAETACVACHRKVDPHIGQLGESCDSCHDETSWLDAAFDHSTTAFPLTGRHSGVNCNACHRSVVFSEVGRTCVACHRSDDVHNGRNGSQCANCHSSTSWTELDFNHLAVSGFALEGGHRRPGCNDCHRAADFLDLGGSDCISCHVADDVHESRNGNDCGSCHNIRDWAATNFDHATRTEFQLPQGHGSLACDACHAGSIRDELPRSCGGCHRQDDVHRAQLGVLCESCHMPTDWTAQLWFDHDITSFPLLGAHAGVSCDSCHTSAAFHDAQDYCVACHGADDPHRGAFDDQCDVCHNPADWQAWQFDHDRQTEFPLTGAHAGARCADCHSRPTQSPASVSDSCHSCHRRDDPHLGRFGNNCGSCHGTTSFTQIEGM